jgi:hypothetical protein
MSTTRSSRTNDRRNKRHANSIEDAEAFVAEHDAREVTHDLTEYLTDYARQNPGTAALVCLGVGIVLGWKLKPW